MKPDKASSPDMGHRPAFWSLNYVQLSDLRSISEPDLALRNVSEELNISQRVTNWKPPRFHVSSKGHWPDWMAYVVPLVSEHALTVLGDMLADNVQLLPIGLGAGRVYYFINVITLIPRSSWSCASNSHVMGDTIIEAKGLTVEQRPIPPIFRLEGYRRPEYVSDELARRSIEANLMGALFVNPSHTFIDHVRGAEPSGSRGGFVV